MKTEIASGIERITITLEEHIKFYQPKQWTVPVHNVAHVPLFTPNEVKKFVEAYESNSLEGLMENDNRPWYIREAIIDFFKTRYQQ